MIGLPAPPRALWLYPSRLAMDQALRQADGACIATDHAYTFWGLVQLLGSAPGGRYVSPLAGRLMVRGLLQSQGGPLQSHGGDAWGVRAVHAALLELRHAGVTARQLGRLPGSPALRELTRLLGRYEETLELRQLFDDADRTRQAILNVACGQVPQVFRDVEHLTVVPGVELFGPRLDLLSAFASRGATVTVTLPWDSGRPGAFAWPEAMLHALEGRGHQSLRVLHDARHGVGPLTAVRAAQFANNDVPVAVPPEASVEVVQVSEGVEHVEYVARRLATWLRAGVPVHALAVVTALDEPFVSRLSRELSRLGIASYCRRGPALAPMPPAQVLLNALRLPAEGFPRDALLDVWRALHSDLTRGDGTWSAAWVEAEVRRAGVRSARLGNLRQSLLAAAARRPAGPGQERAHSMAVAMADALEGLMTRLAAVPDSGPLADYMASMLHLVAAMKTAGSGETALTALHALLVDWLQSAQIDASAPVWQKQEVIDWLSVLLEEGRLDPAASRAGAVAILRPDEVVGSRFARIVFAGANNGVFPRAPAPEPVLTDPLRAEINRLVGPRLVQYAPLSGREALSGQARDLWLWLETWASCQEALVVTVAAAPGEEEHGGSEVVDALLRSTGQARAMAPPSYCDTPVGVGQLVRRWAWAQEPLVAATLREHAPARQQRVEQRAQPERHRQRGTWVAPTLPSADRDRLATQVLGTVHSTSRLDLLGMCGYRHYAAAILNLTVEDLPSLGASPREQGSAAHAALHLVYADIMAHGGLAAARRDEAATLARAQDIFWQNATAILAETTIHPLLRPASLSQAWQAVLVQLGRDLHSSEPWEPLALEYRFDDRPGADAPEFVVTDPAGTRALRVRGSIDRVDSSPGALLTLDYKRTASVRHALRHFQLPIYTAVALRDLAPRAQRVAAGWLGLWDGRQRLADDLAPDPAAFMTTLQQSLFARIDRVLGGTIAPDPDSPDTCERCDFRALCRQAGEVGGTAPVAADETHHA